MFGLDRFDCPLVQVEDFINDTGSTYTFLLEAYQTGLLYENSMRYWVIDPIGVVAYRSGYHELNIPAKQSVIESLLLALDVEDTSPFTQPDGFELSNAYPNPFNPTATLNVTLPALSLLTVTVHDVLGNQVAMAAEGRFVAGTHNIVLDGSSWASGVYFIRANARGFGTLTRKVILMK